MAIVDYGELPQRTGKTDSSFKRSYTRVFEVLSDDFADGPITVAAAVGLGLGNTYQSGNDVDLGAFVQDIEAREVERGQEIGLWNVTVQYGGVDPTQGGENADGNPLNKPIEVRWGSERYERVVDEDINGDPIVNSAGDPFDPPLVIDDSRPVLQITRNEATFDAGLADAYKDTINSEPWRGNDAKTWKVAEITGKREFHAEFGYYYVVDYEFHFRPETWTKRVLNQGMRAKSGSTRKAIATSDGTPISTPVPLDAAGAALAPDGTPIWLEFEVYPSVAFSVFNLE